MSWLVALALLLASLPTTGETKTVNTFMTGSRLYEACQSDSQVCLAYVAAIVDASSVGSSFFKVCTPKTISVRQATVAFQGYVQRHPDLLPYPAAELVLRGLYDTFPCGKISN